MSLVTADMEMSADPPQDIVAVDRVPDRLTTGVSSVVHPVVDVSTEAETARPVAVTTTGIAMAAGEGTSSANAARLVAMEDLSPLPSFPTLIDGSSMIRTCHPTRSAFLAERFLLEA